MVPDPGNPTYLGAAYASDIDSRSRDRSFRIPAAGAHASACCWGTATAALDTEIAAVRAELARIDPKASSYQQTTGVLLGAGLAVLGGAGASGHLPAAALAAGAATAVVVLAAVVFLLLASRPRLGGDFGFVAYADADTAQDVLARVAGDDADQVAQMSPLTRARELWWLSRAVHGKYRAIARAVPLMLAGYAGAAVTAALAIWGR